MFKSTQYCLLKTLSVVYSINRNWWNHATLEAEPIFRLQITQLLNSTMIMVSICDYITMPFNIFFKPSASLSRYSMDDHVAYLPQLDSKLALWKV